MKGKKGKIKRPLSRDLRICASTKTVKARGATGGNRMKVFSPQKKKKIGEEGSRPGEKAAAPEFFGGRKKGD